MVELDDWEKWYAVGSRVAQLSYLGGGRYDAEAVAVVRVTTAMVFTSNGRRFWRGKGMFEVGHNQRRLRGYTGPGWRLVPIDNEHAAPLIEEG